MVKKSTKLKLLIIAIICMIILIIVAFVYFLRVEHTNILNVKLNNEYISLDDVYPIKAALPINYEQNEYEGGFYKSKTYNNLDEVEFDLGIEFMKFPEKLFNDIIIVNIMNNVCKIHLNAIDFLPTGVIEHNENEQKDDFVSVSVMFAYDGGSVDIMLEDESYSNKIYSDFTEEFYNVEDSYSLISEYTSNIHNIKVAIIEKSTETKQGEALMAATSYIALFTKDNLIYYLQSENISAVKDIIELMS